MIWRRATDAAEGRHEYVICANERPMRPKADMNVRLLHYVGRRPRPTWVVKLTSDAAKKKK
jgi:hypothetical protein